MVDTVDIAAAEKIILAICLFSGFLWLRQRARGADLQRQMGRSVLGVFVLLPAILIGEDYLFEHIRFGTYTAILLKVLMMGAAFPAIGLVFIRTDPAQALGGRDDSGRTDA